MSIQTDPLKVENMSFMLERIGRDCDPLQYVRELTQNAMEATQKVPGQKGIALWDYDEEIYQQTGVKKLSITDNGIGMTGEEMVRYINHLASSSNPQSITENFGVGAKISAGVNNPLGMIFMSWKDGIGYKIHFWRDPQTKHYGLKPLTDKDGLQAFWINIDDKHKPDIIKNHGTKVILLGHTEDENTVEAPENASAKSKWIRRFLNSRYATMPDNFQLMVNEGWSRGGRPFPVTGQRSFLDNHSDHRGNLKLRNANAYWWILSESQKANEVESGGHVAAVYHNELYEMKTGTVARPMLQQFGITLGSHRVVIYIEPDTQENECITDTARSRLRMNGLDLPWHEWAHEFEEKMPDPLQKYLEDLLSRDNSNKDYKEAIKSRLQELSSLYDFSNYIPVKDGKNRISPSKDNVEIRQKDKDREPGPQPDIQPPRDSVQVITSDDAGLNSYFKDASGEAMGEKKSQLIIPKVVWVSVARGNRKEGGHLEDKAGECPRPTVLFVNEDFRGYRDLLSLHQKKWNHIKGSGPVVEETVKEWYEQNLVEAVIGGSSLAKTSPTELVISEDFLTAASMPRYNLANNINRVLSRKLGKMSSRLEGSLKMPEPA